MLSGEITPGYITAKFRGEDKWPLFLFCLFVFSFFKGHTLPFKRLRCMFLCGLRKPFGDMDKI